MSDSHREEADAGTTSKHTYPKITASHFIISEPTGAALIPDGGSFCKTLKSLNRRFCAELLVFFFFFFFPFPVFFFFFFCGSSPPSLFRTLLASSSSASISVVAIDVEFDAIVGGFGSTLKQSGSSQRRRFTNSSVTRTPSNVEFRGKKRGRVSERVCASMFQEHCSARLQPKSMEGLERLLQSKCNDKEIDATAWFNDELGIPVKCARIAEAKTMGGMSEAAFLSVAVDFLSDEVLPLRRFIIKYRGLAASSKDADKRKNDKVLEISKSLGLVRESMFYKHMASRLPRRTVCECLHAVGDLSTGKKLMILEDLSTFVPAGLYFGPGNPNNWELDDMSKRIVNAVDRKTTISVSTRAIGLLAELHATFWKDSSLLKTQWLRGSDWLFGKNKESWLTAQQLAIDAWSNMHTDMELWATYPHLARCLDVSVSKTTWANALNDYTRIRSYWTLVQGDCHPGNVMCSEDGQTRLIDFEMIGAGSGAQDIGQFMISHTNPCTRRQCERKLVTEYHEKLTAALRKRGMNKCANSYEFRHAWSEYREGGAGRWCWLVLYISKVCAPRVAKFFMSQLDAFLQDHYPEPKETPALRV